jgi:hypothetical protein
MYASRTAPRDPLSAEGAHEKALMLAEEVEVEWLVGGEGEDVKGCVR